MALGFGFDFMKRAVAQRPWTPRFLFGQGEQGAWYDPSDFSTLYQDSAGTTPVTALGQPVGLMLDKSGNGNHASQSISTARPTVQARVNMLQRTEEFGTSPWYQNACTLTANQTIAPDGELTADLFTVTGALNSVESQVGAPDGDITFSIYAKDDDSETVQLMIGEISNRAFAGYNITSGTVLYSGVFGTGYSNVSTNVQNVGDGWFRLTLSCTKAAGSAGNTIRVYSTSNTGGFDVNATVGKTFYLWGAQLEVGTTATTYQRVTTATDYEDIGLPRYLQFDGTDDSLSTASVDFGASNEMTVCAGAESAFGTQQMFVELSDNANFNTGAFNMFRRAIGSYGYGVWTPNQRIASSSVYTTSDRAVLTLQNNISAPSLFGRRNGVQVGQNLLSQGGTLGDYPLFIGSRNQAVSFLNGRIHQLIVRGATTAGALLDATERYVARKTGVTL